MSNEIKLVPIGGLGEVGMNNMLVHTPNLNFMIDCGTASSHSPWLGYDSVFPDYLQFFPEKFEWPKTIILTHGHEDHIGALPYFLKLCPHKLELICTEFTSKLIRWKLDEQNFSYKYEMRVLSVGSKYEFSPNCFLRFVPNNHSIYDSNALVIEIDGFLMVHTGDFRIDKESFREKTFDLQKLLPEGRSPDLLMSDSTNAERSGWSISESVVLNSFEEIFSKEQGACVLTCFASNVRRLQSAIEAAVKTGRKIASFGRAMDKFLHLSQEAGIFRIPESSRLDLKDLSTVERKEILILMTGSQGEFQASFSRLAYGTANFFQLEERDFVIFSALEIPGNELRIRSILNRLKSLGLKIYTNKNSNYTVHSTGHAYSDELSELLQTLKPKVFVPVHGDRIMMERHAELAKQKIPNIETYIIEDGMELHWGKNVWEKREIIPLPTKRWAKYQESGDINSEAMKDRKKIAREGMLCIAIHEESLWNNFPSAIQIEFIGMITFDGKEAFEKNEIIKKMERDFYSKFPKFDKSIEEWVRSWVRTYFKKVFQIRPVIKLLSLK